MSQDETKGKRKAKAGYGAQLLGGYNRQSTDKPGSMTRATTNGQVATTAIETVLYNSQPQTRATGGGVAAAVAAVKALGQPRHFCRVYADAIILNTNTDMV